jgi:hypothetical protein
VSPCPRTVQNASVEKVVDYHVEPVKLCSSCFDVEAEKAKVRYSFANVTATLARRRHGTSVVKHGSGC